MQVEEVKSEAPKEEPKQAAAPSPSANKGN